MITEDYCSFELSKLLKEKGLKGITRRYFYNGGLFCDNNVNESDWNSKGDKWVSQPTHQMAMKWLRCEGIYIEIDVLGKTNIKYGFTILKLNDGEIYSDDKIYTTYEEAVEAALEYALEKYEKLI